ncbi:MAG TPA: iron reductase, partial [Candidatus Sericytochromatia bacterium]
SNDWSVKKLKKNWKRLHQLTYCAMFLLAWHIWDKMSEHWSLITPLGILALAATIILFLKRRWIEWQQQKAKEQKSQPAQQTATTTYI